MFFAIIIITITKFRISAIEKNASSSPSSSSSCANDDAEKGSGRSSDQSSDGSSTQSSVRSSDEKIPIITEGGEGGGGGGIGGGGDKVTVTKSVMAAVASAVIHTASSTKATLGSADLNTVAATDAAYTHCKASSKAKSKKPSESSSLIVQFSKQSDMEKQPLLS